MAALMCDALNEKTAARPAPATVWVLVPMYKAELAGENSRVC
jgi:hypothetical protein